MTVSRTVRARVPTKDVSSSNSANSDERTLPRRESDWAIRRLLLLHRELILPQSPQIIINMILPLQTVVWRLALQPFDNYSEQRWSREILSAMGSVISLGCWNWLNFFSKKMKCTGIAERVFLGRRGWVRLQIRSNVFLHYDLHSVAIYSYLWTRHASALRSRINRRGRV